MSNEFQLAPDNVHGYIGPALMMALLQSVETGVIVGQAMTFWSYTSAPMASPLYAYRDNGPTPGRGSATARLTRNGMLLKIVATYVLLLTILQTTFTFYETWISLVVNWGKLPEAVQIHSLTKLQPVINTMLSVPVQGFLIWRCWLLTNCNNHLLIFLITLVIASAAMSAVFTVGAFSYSPLATSGTIFDISAIFTTSLAIPTLLDALLTGILLTYLIRSRNVVVSRHFRKMLHMLIAIIWEAAFPPCMCAVITIAIYFKSAKTSSWFLLFQTVLGQLYVISFFVTINGFLSVKNRDSGLSPTTAFGQSWGTASPERHIEVQNPERALSPGLGREECPNGVNVIVNVQTTLDSPTGSIRRAVYPPRRSLSSRLQRIPRLSHRPSHGRVSHSAHFLDIPVGMHLPSPDVKDSDEMDRYVKAMRENSDYEGGKDGKSGMQGC